MNRSNRQKTGLPKRAALTAKQIWWKQFANEFVLPNLVVMFERTSHRARRDISIPRPVMEFCQDGADSQPFQARMASAYIFRRGGTRPVGSFLTFTNWSGSLGIRLAEGRPAQSVMRYTSQT